MDDQPALREAVTREPQVTVVGEDRVVVTPDVLDRVEVATETFEIICATGNT